MVVVKHYSKEFEEQHIAFAKKYWTKKRRLTPEYIYWKFRGKNTELLKSFILAFDGDKVVGQFGLVPSKVFIDGIIYDSQWACDLMVDHEYRGKGVADALYEFAHENGKVTLGSDPSPAAEKSMIKKGYISISGPRKFVFPIKLGEILKLKGYNYHFFNIIYNPFVLILKLFTSVDFQPIKSNQYIELKSKYAENKIHCIYDDEFVDWRFSAFEDYYGGIQCYQKNENTFFCGYFSNGIYYLTDFHAYNLFSFLSIIGFVYQNYGTKNLVRIKFVSNDESLSNKLPFLGFIRFRTLTKVILFSKEKSIREKALSNSFYYTLFDSDENI